MSVDRRTVSAIAVVYVLVGFHFRCQGHAVANDGADRLEEAAAAAVKELGSDIW